MAAAAHPPKSTGGDGGWDFGQYTRDNVVKVQLTQTTMNRMIRDGYEVFANVHALTSPTTGIGGVARAKGISASVKKSKHHLLIKYALPAYTDGSLRDVMRRDGGFANFGQRMGVATSLLTTLNKLRKGGLAHFNINPDTIMMYKSSPSATEWKPVYTSFGMMGMEQWYGALEPVPVSQGSATNWLQSRKEADKRYEIVQKEQLPLMRIPYLGDRATDSEDAFALAQTLWELFFADTSINRQASAAEHGAKLDWLIMGIYDTHPTVATPYELGRINKLFKYVIGCMEMGEGPSLLRVSEMLAAFTLGEIGPDDHPFEWTGHANPIAAAAEGKTRYHFLDAATAVLEYGNGSVRRLLDSAYAGTLLCDPKDVTQPLEQHNVIWRYMTLAGVVSHAISLMASYFVHNPKSSWPLHDTDDHRLLDCVIHVALVTAMPHYIQISGFWQAEPIGQLYMINCMHIGIVPPRTRTDTPQIWHLAFMKTMAAKGYTIPWANVMTHIIANSERWFGGNLFVPGTLALATRAMRDHYEYARRENLKDISDTQHVVGFYMHDLLKFINYLLVPEHMTVVVAMHRNVRDLSKYRGKLVRQTSVMVEQLFRTTIFSLRRQRQMMLTYGGSSADVPALGAVQFKRVDDLTVRGMPLDSLITRSYAILANVHMFSSEATARLSGIVRTSSIESPVCDSRDTLTVTYSRRMYNAGTMRNVMQAPCPSIRDFDVYVNIIQQLLVALADMHNAHMYHRNISPEAILMHKWDDGSWEAAYTSFESTCIPQWFGVAAPVPIARCAKRGYRYIDTIPEQLHVSTMKTAGPPKSNIYTGEIATPLADTWALLCTLWEFLFGTTFIVWKGNSIGGFYEDYRGDAAHYKELLDGYIARIHAVHSDQRNVDRVYAMFMHAVKAVHNPGAMVHVSANSILQEFMRDRPAIPRQLFTWTGPTNPIGQLPAGLARTNFKKAVSTIFRSDILHMEHGLAALYQDAVVAATLANAPGLTNHHKRVWGFMTLAGIMSHVISLLASYFVHNPLAPWPPTDVDNSGINHFILHIAISANMPYALNMDRDTRLSNQLAVAYFSSCVGLSILEVHKIMSKREADARVDVGEADLGIGSRWARVMQHIVYHSGRWFGNNVLVQSTLAIASNALIRGINKDNFASMTGVYAPEYLYASYSADHLAYLNSLVQADNIDEIVNMHTHIRDMHVRPGSYQNDVFDYVHGRYVAFTAREKQRKGGAAAAAPSAAAQPATALSGLFDSTSA